MVGRGEVLERMTLLEGAEGPLEALFQPGAGIRTGIPVVFAPPHPRLAGSMDSPVLGELAWSLGRRGHPTLRFNYRGVGASAGVIDLPPLPSDHAHSLSGLVADLSTAVEHHLATCGAARCVVVGYSVGAWVAAELALHHPAVVQVVLIAPPTSVVTRTRGVELAATGMPVAVLVGSEDAVASAAAVDERLRPLRCQVIPGANHGFVRGLPLLARAVLECVPGPDAADRVWD